MKRLHLPAALLLVVAAAASAETGAEDSRYRDLVKGVVSGDASVDYRELRLACARASVCDPKGDGKDIAALRKALEEKQFAKAAALGEAMIERGFANIEAHAICGQAHAAMNHEEKAKFHRGVTTGLIRSILATGDGKTKETAFEVIGTHEEYIVISVLGLPRPKSQGLVSGKPHSYDVLTVVDPKTREETSIFFNIDAFFPMKGL